MKLIIAIIKPFKLNEVRQALTGLGVSGILRAMVSPIGLAVTGAVAVIGGETTRPVMSREHREPAPGYGLMPSLASAVSTSA